LHISYPEQLKEKQNRLENILKPFSPCTLRPILGMADPFYYRHKVQLPFGIHKGKIVLGCYEDETHRVIDSEHCLLQDRSLTFITRTVVEWARKNGYPIYDEKKGTGILRHLLLRKSWGTGEILVGFIINDREFPGYRSLNRFLLEKFEDYVKAEKSRDRIAGIIQNVNLRMTNVVLGEFSKALWGKSFITEKLGNFEFQISLQSFFQVNPSQAVVLFNTVRNLCALSGKEKIVDAYAGTGTMALWVAKDAKQVTAIEEQKKAVEDGKKNLLRNFIRNVRFMQGDAGEAFVKDFEADVVILDPPRKGCGDKMCSILAHSKIPRIVYVSCNPNSFCHDMEILAKSYKLETVQPVDMFPHTDHVEMAAQLIRK
jgi:23S rRNA (uracil1939-C5)-methyltransferase